MTRWLAQQTEDGAAVYPVDDLVDHEPGTDCVCVPSVEHLDATDGSDAWLVIHHSLDGREQAEQNPSAPDA